VNAADGQTSGTQQSADAAREALRVLATSTRELEQPADAAALDVLAGWDCSEGSAESVTSSTSGVMERAIQSAAVGPRLNASAWGVIWLVR
jgi:hypothetical protein